MFKSEKTGSIPLKEESLYWHDYETSGPNARLDRPYQFAGIRTDLELNEIDPPLMAYCKPAMDLLPHPHACVLTGISPQLVQKEGLSEFDFSGLIFKELSKPKTCGVGYNSIKFDDEITRHLFYRNFLPVYEREWQNGNSRWDVLGLMRLTYVLRPNTLVWPKNEENHPSFKLENLGEINHCRTGDAHDALSDVRCTIALTKKVKEACPDLFEETFTNRTKNKLIKLVEESMDKRIPLLHAAPFYNSQSGYVGLVMPIGFHPTRPQIALMLNLQGDVEELLSLSEEELEERFSRPLEEDEVRLPIQLVALNRAPALLSAKWLKGVDCNRVGFDIKKAALNSKRVLADKNFINKFNHVLTKISKKQDSELQKSDDFDLALYDGFPTPDETRLINQVRQSDPQQLSQIDFENKKYNALLFRYRARNFSETLNEVESQIWKAYCKKRLNQKDFAGLNFEDYEIALNIEKEKGVNPLMIENLKNWKEEVQNFLLTKNFHNSKPKINT